MRTRPRMALALAAAVVVVGCGPPAPAPATPAPPASGPAGRAPPAPVPAAAPGPIVLVANEDGFLVPMVCSVGEGEPVFGPACLRSLAGAVDVELAGGRVLRAHKTRANAGCAEDDAVGVPSAVLADDTAGDTADDVGDDLAGDEGDDEDGDEADDTADDVAGKASVARWTVARVLGDAADVHGRLDLPVSNAEALTPAQRSGVAQRFAGPPPPSKRWPANRPVGTLRIDQAVAIDVDGDRRPDQIYAVSRNGGGHRRFGFADLVVELAARPGTYERVFARSPGAARYQVVAVTDVDGDGRAEIIAIEHWLNDYYLRVIEFGSDEDYQIGCGMV